jgi:hypothetical protein
MATRTQWQYCQIEVGANSMGLLRQFFPDRQPVETDLHQTWPAMLGKLGEQGWELVSVFPNEGGRGRSPLTYVLKRAVGSGAGAQTANPVSSSMPPAPSSSGPVKASSQEKGPITDFEPLDF